MISIKLTRKDNGSQFYICNHFPGLVRDTEDGAVIYGNTDKEITVNESADHIVETYERGKIIEAVEEAVKTIYDLLPKYHEGSVIREQAKLCRLSLEAILDMINEGGEY
jgi:hypothetical protein